MNIPGTSLDNFHATASARRTDELARAYVDAVSAGDVAALYTVLARTFLSYSCVGVRSRTATKKYYDDLRKSFSDLYFQVHENVGVLVENDLVAFRAIVTGVHAGDYAGVPATGKQIQTSVSHFFRLRGDQFVEHWQVMDTYRILVKIGRLPGVAAGFQRMLGVPDPLRACSWNALVPISTRHARGGGSRERSYGPSAVESTSMGRSRRATRATSIRWPRITCKIPAGRPTVGQSSATPGPSGEARCRMGWPSRPMWWPRTIESGRSACGTEPSPPVGNPWISAPQISCGSRMMSRPSTGTPSTTSACTRRSACSRRTSEAPHLYPSTDKDRSPTDVANCAVR
jgi:predicted ester cyclase